MYFILYYRVRYNTIILRSISYTVLYIVGGVLIYIIGESVLISGVTIETCTIVSRVYLWCNCV